VAIQLTSGGSIVAVPGSVDSLQSDSFNSDVTIAPVDNYVIMLIDTSASRTITLPLASAVSNGRIYIIKDATGTSESNPITVATSGADTLDGAASQSFSSAYGTFMVSANGTTSWNII